MVVYAILTELTPILAWVNTLAAVGAVMLVVAGLFLLLAPPKPLLDRLLQVRSIHEGLIGIVGVFLIVLGIEQVYVFSASLSRWVDFRYSPRSWDIAGFVVAWAVPPGMALWGWRMTRPQKSSELSGQADRLSLVGLWPLGAMIVGAFVLSQALPTLSELVSFVRMNRNLSQQDYYIAYLLDPRHVGWAANCLGDLPARGRPAAGAVAPGEDPGADAGRSRGMNGGGRGQSGLGGGEEARSSVILTQGMVVRRGKRAGLPPALNGSVGRQPLATHYPPLITHHSSLTTSSTRNWPFSSMRTR